MIWLFLEYDIFAKEKFKKLGGIVGDSSAKEHFHTSHDSEDSSEKNNTYQSQRLHQFVAISGYLLKRPLPSQYRNWTYRQSTVASNHSHYFVTNQIRLELSKPQHLFVLWSLWEWFFQCFAVNRSLKRKQLRWLHHCLQMVIGVLRIIELDAEILPLKLKIIQKYMRMRKSKIILKSDDWEKIIL